MGEDRGRVRKKDRPLTPRKDQLPRPFTKRRERGDQAQHGRQPKRQRPHHEVPPVEQEELQRVQRIRKLRVLQPCRDAESVDAGLAFVCRPGIPHGAGPAHEEGNAPSDDEEDTDPANTPIRGQFIVCGHSRIESEVPRLAHAPNQNMPREKPHHIPQLEEAQ